MKKYMTDKDRAAEADALRTALMVAHIGGLELDTNVPIPPAEFARYLIAPASYVIIVPATAEANEDRQKIEKVMCMSQCDAIVMHIIPKAGGPRKIMFEIGIDGLVPVWHSEYSSRIVDGDLFFVPDGDPGGPLFKLTKQGLKSSADFDGMRFNGYP